jgi:hypothetical protein
MNMVSTITCPGISDVDFGTKLNNFPWVPSNNEQRFLYDDKYSIGCNFISFAKLGTIDSAWIGMWVLGGN